MNNLTRTVLAYFILTASFSLRAAEGGLVLGKIGNFLNFKKNEDQRTSIPVHVRVRTILSETPTVYASFGDFIKTNTIAGVEMPIGKKAEKGTFELMANETERSVNVNRVPANLQFSFSLPEESSTNYIVNFPSSKIENVELTVTKKSRSLYPESTHTALFKFSGESFLRPKTLKNFLPPEHQLMNDYVHPWRVKVEFKSPKENDLPEYFVEITEIDPSEYLKDDDLLYWNLLKQNSTAPLAKYPSFDLNKTALNSFHISILHLAIRFKNLPMIKELLSKEAQFPWKSFVPTQGVPFLMALKLKETAVPFLEAYEKLSTENQTVQSGLEIGFQIEKAELLDLVDEKMANEIFLKEESYGNLIKYLTLVTLGSTSERLRNVLKKLSLEKRSTPFYRSEIFFQVFSKLSSEQNLLSLYESSATYADRITASKAKIQNIKKLEEELYDLGMTPTPVELFELAFFMIERKNVESFEIKKRDSVINLSKLIFSNPEDFEHYYKKAQDNPKELYLDLQKRYQSMRKKDGTIRAVLIEEQKKFTSRKEGEIFNIEGMKFIKNGSRLFLKEI